jgi:hypothetical protein
LPVWLPSSAPRACPSRLLSRNKRLSRRKRPREPERATPKHVALNWARRLKRVFGIEIEQCARCHGRLLIRSSGGLVHASASGGRCCARRGRGA